MKGVIVSRCRRCREEIVGEEFDPKDGFLGIEVFGTHECSDGKFGITELVGYNHVKCACETCECDKKGCGQL